MVTVRTKEELKKAIESGETEIHVSSKRLLAACWLASKLHHSSDSELNNVSNGILPTGVATAGFAIGGTAIIILAIIGCVTAIAIVAICKENDVEIEVDYENGTIKVKTKKQ